MVSDDLLRAEPQHDHDAAKGEKKRGNGDDPTRLRHPARRVIGVVGRVAVAVGGERFGDEGLHDAHRRQALGRESGRFGQRVLGPPRPLANRATRSEKRQHDDRNRREHISREFRAGHHHHRDRADEHEEVAQRDRGGRAECRLELGRIRRQAGDDLPGLFVVEERRVEPGELGEELGAEVRHDPFAERRHEIVAGAGGEREYGDDPDHRQEIAPDQAGVGIREAEVDHPAHRQRNDQRRRRSDHERNERRRHAPAVGEGVRQHRFEGAERDTARPCAGVGGGRHGHSEAPGFGRL